MRIALLHPTYWPEVRRGSERLVHDLGVVLAGRGHEVTLLTSHRGPPRTSVEEGVRVVRCWAPAKVPLFGLHEDHLGVVPNVLWRLPRGGFDVAHAFFLADAWAAVRARRLGGPPVVFSFHGIPTREFLVMRRGRLEMMQGTVAGAAARTVLSEAAARPFRRYLLDEPRVLGGGTFRAAFETGEARAAVPTLLCAASLGDPRKRGELLLAAFRALRERRPDARLLLVRTPDPFMSPLSMKLPEGARWIEAQRTDALARAYASAWASVLPAPDEAFGLVLVESLAAGTPVVAARSGACPEIVRSGAVGRLFEPDDERDLARAMDEALELGSRVETAEACRAEAAGHDWSTVADRYEELYAEVLGSAGRGRS